MAVRNILDSLTGGNQTVVDTFFYTRTIDWSGAGTASGTITYVKSNNLCIIILSPFTTTTTSTDEFNGTTGMPPNMVPKDNPLRYNFTLVNNTGHSVGVVYLQNGQIHISGDSYIGSYFQSGTTNAGIPYGATIVYHLIQ